MADGSVVRGIAGSATRFYYRYVEPPLFAMRKDRRLRLLGVRDVADLPVAVLDMEENRPECVASCRVQIDSERRHLDKFLFRPDHNASAFSRWRGVPQVLDLDAFPDFQSYVDKVAGRDAKRRDKARDIKKARALGYYVKPIGRATHYEEMIEIQSSKLFRTGGLVIAALPGVQRAMSSARYWDWNECALHWGSVWGAFTPERKDQGNTCERLAAYCHMRRVGNRIHGIALMGHAAHLRNGVVKLLFFEVMRWLLDRQDPRVIGVRYFQGGAIEQGRESSLAWKRRFQFQPYVYAWSNATPATAG
jgi:hypothetical protein